MSSTVSPSLLPAFNSYVHALGWVAGGGGDFRAVQELGLKVVRSISGGGCLTVQCLQSLLSACLVVVAQRIEPVGRVEG